MIGSNGKILVTNLEPAIYISLTKAPASIVIGRI